MQKDINIVRQQAVGFLATIVFLVALAVSPIIGIAQAQEADLDEIWDFDQPADEPAQADEPVETDEPAVDEPAADEPAPVVADNERGPVAAADAGDDELARLEREELVRRQERLLEAEDMLREGNRLLRENQYEQAIAQYREAKQKLEQVSRTAPDVLRRIERVDGMIHSAYTAWVEDLMGQARATANIEQWDEAQEILRRAFNIAPPERRGELNRLRERLEAMREEVEFKAAVAPEAVDPDKPDRDYEITVLMEQGKQLYSHRRYSEARDAFERVLLKDPYSVEAMRWLRQISKRWQEAGEERRLSTREEMLARTIWNWSQPIRPIDREDRPVGVERVDRRIRTDARIREKMQNIIFPRIEFEEATIHQVVRYLQQTSRELDPDEEGVNIILHLTGDEPPRERDPARRPAAPAFDDFDDFRSRERDPTRRPAAPAFDDFDDFGVDLPAIDEPAQARGALTLNMENVPLGEVIRFVTMSAGLRYHVEQHAVIISDRELPEGELVTRFFPVQAGLFRRRDRGDVPDDPWGAVEVDEPTAVDPSDVRGYFRNLGVAFPEGSSIAYDDRISTLIVRNTERNIQEIEGILEQINVPPAQVTIEAKFVEVSQRDLEGLGFQWMLMDDVEIFSARGRPRSLVLQGPQSGARATDLSMGVRAITDAVGTGQLGQILGATAILGNFELDVVLHALSQTGNTDVLSAPKVTTTSGNTALIRIVRERYFPVDWEPAETEREGDTDIVTVITPPTPVWGDPRDIGVRLEVTPTVEEDRYTIALDLRPEVIEFIGYDTEIPDFPMPIIEARTIDTAVIVYNNETVVLGGMIRDEIQEFEDKIPILGDIPLLGRLFRNRGSRAEKRNLLIFVTARLVDPAGQPVREEPLRGVPDFHR